MAENDRLIAIDLDDQGLPPPTPEIEQERRVAMFDLLDRDNSGNIEYDEFEAWWTGKKEIAYSSAV